MALIKNFDQAENATQSALEAEGSAMKEYSIHMDTVQASLNTLASTWQDFSTTFLQSDFLKSGIDSLSTILNIINELIEKVGTVPALLGAISVVPSLKNQGFFRTVGNTNNFGKSMTTSLGSWMSAINTPAFSYDEEFSNALKADIASLTEYKNAVMSGMNSGEAFDLHMANASLTAKQYAKDIDASSLAINTYASEQRQSVISLTAQSRSFSQISSLIKDYQGGLKGCGLKQEEFFSAIQYSNPSLHKYLSNVNRAEASMGGYIRALALGKASTIALTVATTALNMALTMGIAVAISALVKAIGDAIVTQAELREEVEETISVYNDQKTEIENNGKTLNGLKDRYAELSKGVNEIGENISLTTEEFAEYNEITNKIAEMFPSLIQGYTDEGNAILKVKGNVKGLTNAYNEMTKANNNALLTKANKVFENFNNQTEEAKKGKALFGGIFGGFFRDNKQLRKSDINVLQTLIRSGDKESLKRNYNELVQEYESVGSDIGDRLLAAIEGAVGEVEGTGAFGAVLVDDIVDTIDKNKDKLQPVVDKFYEDYKEIAEQMKNVAQAYISNAFIDEDYSNITDKMQTIIGQFIPYFDTDFYNQFDGNFTDLHKYIDDMLSKFNNLSPYHADLLEGMVDINSEFANGTLTLEEYLNEIEQVESVLGLFDEETQANIKIAFKIDDASVSQVTTLSNQIVNSLTSDDTGSSIVSKKNAQILVNRLTKDEIQSISSIIPKDTMEYTDRIKEINGDISTLSATLQQLYSNTADDESIKNLKEEFPELANETKNLDGAIESLIYNLSSEKNVLQKSSDVWIDFLSKVEPLINRGEMEQAISLFEETITTLNTVANKSNFSLSISEEITKVDTLFTALSESANGLSDSAIEAIESMFSTMEGYDSSKLFHLTSSGIRLNVEEFSKLQDAYADANLDKTKNELTRLREEYDLLTLKIANCKNETIKANLINERNALKENIESVANLASQYEALSSSFNKWQKALSSANAGSNYDVITEGLESIKALRDNGLVGTDDFRQAVQMMTSKDVSGASASELTKIFDTNYKNFTKYFTEGTKGTTLFLKDVQKINDEYAKLTKDGWIIDINSDNIKEVSKELQLADDIIVDILLKLQDQGANIEIVDIIDELEREGNDVIAVYERFNDVVNQALSKKGKAFDEFHYDFNFEADESQIEDEILKAKNIFEQFAGGDPANINLAIDGASEIQAIYEKLLLIQTEFANKDLAIMRVDTSKSDSQLYQVIDKLQRIKTLSDEVEIGKKIGKDISATQTQLEALFSSITQGEKDVMNKLKISTDGLNLDNFAERLSLTDVDILAKVGVDQTHIDEFKSATDKGENDADATVKYEPDTKAVDDYVFEPKRAEVIYDVNRTISNANIRAYVPPIIHSRYNALDVSQNTSRVNGTAFANGNIGEKHDFTSLVGELGEELVSL